VFPDRVCFGTALAQPHFGNSCLWDTHSFSKICLRGYLQRQGVRKKKIDLAYAPNPVRKKNAPNGLLGLKPVAKIDPTQCFSGLDFRHANTSGQRGRSTRWFQCFLFKPSVTQFIILGVENCREKYFKPNLQQSTNHHF
jgi:hypothetical protein